MWERGRSVAPTRARRSRRRSEIGTEAPRRPHSPVELAVVKDGPGTPSRQMLRSQYDAIVSGGCRLEGPDKACFPNASC